jgi:hypothetical protein
MFATGGPAVNTRIVTVPRASNANLHAQQGVFTLSEPQNDLGGEPVRRFSISKAYQDFIERCRSAAAPADATRKPSVGTRSRPPDHLINPPALFHLTLPSAEAGKVLWYLDKSHINAARLFPEFGGAARAITERLYQQRPES